MTVEESEFGKFVERKLPQESESSFVFWTRLQGRSSEVIGAHRNRDGGVGWRIRRTVRPRVKRLNKKDVVL